MNIISIKTRGGEPIGELSTEHATSHYGQPTWDGKSTPELAGKTLTIILDGDLTVDRSEWPSPAGFEAKVLYADEAWLIVDVADYGDRLWALNLSSGTYHRLLHRRANETQFGAICDPGPLLDELDADEIPGMGSLTQQRLKLAIDLDQLKAEDTFPDISEDEKSLGLVLV